jgi:hypothetical protein
MRRFLSAPLEVRPLSFTGTLQGHAAFCRVASGGEAR